MSKDCPIPYCQSCLIPMEMLGIDDNCYVFKCLKCKRSKTKIPVSRAATAKVVIPQGVIIDKSE